MAQTIYTDMFPDIAGNHDFGGSSCCFAEMWTVSMYTDQLCSPAWCYSSDMNIAGGNLNVCTNAVGWCDVCASNFVASSCIVAGSALCSSIWCNNSSMVIAGGDVQICTPGGTYNDIDAETLCARNTLCGVSQVVSPRWCNTSDMLIDGGDVCVCDAAVGWCNVCADNFCAQNAVNSLICVYSACGGCFVTGGTSCIGLQACSCCGYAIYTSSECCTAGCMMSCCGCGLIVCTDFYTFGCYGIISHSKYDAYQGCSYCGVGGCFLSCYSSGIIACTFDYNCFAGEFYGGIKVCTCDICVTTGNLIVCDTEASYCGCIFAQNCIQSCTGYCICNSAGYTGTCSTTTGFQLTVCQGLVVNIQPPP